MDTDMNAWKARCKVSEATSIEWTNASPHWGSNPRLKIEGFRDNAIKLDRKAARQGKPITVFPSMCDPFDRQVPIEWLADFLDVIRKTPNLRWLLLTKRPELFRERLIAARGCMFADPLGVADKNAWLDGRYWHNVAIGTSVENQELADKRIPELLKIPARWRFLSIEPTVSK